MGVISNMRVHQTQYIYKSSTHLPVVELTVDRDLTLGDVASKIGNRVGDVCEANVSKVYPTQTKGRTIVRHGEDGDLGNGSVPALDTTGALVDGRQVRVHVSGVSTASGYLFSGRRDL